MKPCSAFLNAILWQAEIKPVFETLEDCYQQGEAAASQGFRRTDNPYPESTARRQWWDAGWLNDLDELCGT